MDVMFKERPYLLVREAELMMSGEVAKCWPLDDGRWSAPSAFASLRAG